jgi:hypothetical protein
LQLPKKRTPQTMEKRRREHEKQQKRLAKQARRLDRRAAKKRAAEAGEVAPELDREDEGPPQPPEPDA